MTLIYNELDDTWVWVEDKNHDIELSPTFDYEEDAKLWRTRMINILLRGKNDIQQDQGT
jgi:hypothetical protein